MPHAFSPTGFYCFLFCFVSYFKVKVTKIFFSYLYVCLVFMWHYSNICIYIFIMINVGTKTVSFLIMYNYYYYSEMLIRCVDGCNRIVPWRKSRFNPTVGRLFFVKIFNQILVGSLTTRVRLTFYDHNAARCGLTHKEIRKAGVPVWPGTKRFFL